MGLFINKGEHPEVYKTKDKINDNNQRYFKKDYFTELAEQQKQMSHSLSKLESLYDQQGYLHKQEWNGIRNRLNELKESNSNHEEFEKIAIKSFASLNENNQKLQVMLENEEVSKQDIQQQLSVLQKSNYELVSEIAEYGSENEHLTGKIDELVILQKQLAEQQQSQQDKHETVLERLENQEALMEKATRQLTNLRSILYERTNYIVDRVENSYKLTSSLLYKMMTGSERPLTFFYEEAKKIDSKENLD